MAVAVYTKDLTDINLGVMDWVELDGATAGGSPEADINNFIEGTGAICKSFSTTGIGSMARDNGSNITITAGAAVFIWIYHGCPNTLDTLINGGYRVAIGNLVSAYKMWKVLGKDTYTYGGWVNVVVDPTIAADYTYGSPTTATRFFGSVVNQLIDIARGYPYVNDAIRWGRTLQIVSGQAGAYGTFAAAATANDDINARWGLFQAIAGGYLQKGLFLMGTAATAVDFRDLNRNIVIQDTTKVAAAFNEYEVRNASSRIDWTNIQITALGTTSKGKFTTTHNADINFDTCTFTDMDTFGFLAQSTLLTTIFRRCGIVTQGGGVFTSCRFESASGTKALVVDTITNVTNTVFVSKGTGYAIEGFSSAGDYTLTGLTFTGFAVGNGSTGNEAIHVLATSGVVNLNIAGGGSPSPSIHTAGATVNVIAGAVNATVTVKNSAVPPVAIVNAMVLVLATAGGSMPVDATVTITRSGSTATVTHTAHGMATNDKVQIKGANEIEYNGVFVITKINDNSYSYTVSGTPATPATGTIKATYAALYGLTNSSGIITMSRVFSSSQPISGKARKSTGTPIYKPSNTVGEINSSTGFSVTMQMIPDE